MPPTRTGSRTSPAPPFPPRIPINKAKRAGRRRWPRALAPPTLVIDVDLLLRGLAEPYAVVIPRERRSETAALNADVATRETLRPPAVTGACCGDAGVAVGPGKGQRVRALALCRGHFVELRGQRGYYAGRFACRVGSVPEIRTSIPCRLLGRIKYTLSHTLVPSRPLDPSIACGA